MTKTQKLLNQLVDAVAQGDQFQEYNVQMKLMMKGIKVRQIKNGTEDPEMDRLIMQAAQEYQVQLQENA